MASFLDKIGVTGKHGLTHASLGDVVGGTMHGLEQLASQVFDPSAHPFGGKKGGSSSAPAPQSNVTLPPDIQKWVGLQQQAKSYVDVLTRMGLDKATATNYIDTVWLPQQMATTATGQSSIGGDLSGLAKTMTDNLKSGVQQWNQAYQGDVNTAASMADQLKGMLPGNYKALGPLLDNMLQADRGVGDAMSAQALADPMNSATAGLASRAFQQALKNYMLDQQNLVASSGTGTTAANPFTG